MIELTDEMRDRLASALDDGCPVVVATVDEVGQPKLSFYGSTHVHGPDQLAIWVRNPEGGTLRRIAANPRMSLLYRNPAAKVRWLFEGRAHRVPEEDVALRDRVYDETPELERLMDAEKAGVAVIVDLDLVTGRGLEMRRP